VLVHVEAGLRSGDWQMPEERTRVIVDHLADLRLAPTVDAVSTLADEGVIRGVRRVGDVRADAVALSRATGTESAAAAVRSDVPDSYVLATVHRQSTTDDGPTLRSVIDGLGARVAPGRVADPSPNRRPPARERDARLGRRPRPARRPGGLRRLLGLLNGASAVATDSGGVQREASYPERRASRSGETTEWRGTVDRGENVLVGTDAATIAAAVDTAAAGPPEMGTCRPVRQRTSSQRSSAGEAMRSSMRCESMRVLQLVPSAGSTAYRGQVRALRRRGVDCATLAVPGSHVPGEQTRSVLDYLRHLGQTVRASLREFDLVHANQGVVAPTALAAVGLPTVVSLWGQTSTGRSDR